MPVGAVKWFNPQKGYGLTRDLRTIRLYSRPSSRSPQIGNLHEGQKVRFELEHGDRGTTSAVNLKQA
ncbi:MAG: cold-shock protein [Alphaproteobacteria bacterium]|nr:cold-shock protein [Alphaproteobacteria bacterium]